MADRDRPLPARRPDAAEDRLEPAVARRSGAIDAVLVGGIGPDRRAGMALGLLGDNLGGRVGEVLLNATCSSSGSAVGVASRRAEGGGPRGGAARDAAEGALGDGGQDRAVLRARHRPAPAHGVVSCGPPEVGLLAGGARAAGGAQAASVDADETVGAPVREAGRVRWALGRSARDDGELGLGPEPLARRPFSVLGRPVRHEVEPLGGRLVGGEAPPGARGAAQDAGLRAPGPGGAPGRARRGAAWGSGPRRGWSCGRSGDGLGDGGERHDAVPVAAPASRAMAGHRSPQGPASKAARAAGPASACLCAADGVQLGHDGAAVLPGHVERAADQVHDGALHDGLGERGLDRLGEARPVHDRDQPLGDAAGLELAHDPEPGPRPLGLPGPEAHQRPRTSRAPSGWMASAMVSARAVGLGAMAPRWLGSRAKPLVAGPHPDRVEE